MYDALTCTYDVSQRVPKFTGKERDTESNLDYFGDRHYGSSLGRFMQPDEPLNDQETGDPQSWNLYSYVRNNPLNRTDPNGRDCVYTSNQTSQSVTVTVETGSCSGSNGTYVSGTIDVNSLKYNGQTGDLSYSFSDSSGEKGGVGVIGLEPSRGQMSDLGVGVLSQPVLGYARNTVNNYIAPPLMIFLGFAVPGALSAGGPEITSLGLLKSAAEALPKLGGLTKEAAKEALEKNGFKQQGITKGGYEKWGHPDGSKVWIGPDGGIDKIPPGGPGYRVTPDGDIARPHTFPEEKLK